MKPLNKWSPMLLSALVLPGAGQWLIGKKLKGGLMMGITLLLVTAGISRYLALVFALINRHGATRPPHLNPFPVLYEAWQLDHRLLIGFLLGILAVWLLSILDLWLTPKEDVVL